MFIKRIAQKLLQEKIQAGKAVLLYGPRRVGKTTLLNEFARDYPRKGKIKYVNAETKIIQESLSVRAIEPLKLFIGDSDILIIDEAQKVPEVGSAIKLIVDSIPSVAVVASGSASLDLSQKVGEPLTGRKKTINLFPISAGEIIAEKGREGYLEGLENFLIHGSYPELFNLESVEKQREYLRELADSYLFQDILELEDIRNAKKIRDLLTALALQVGKEVSLSELSRILEISKNTVFRYLDLLEKSFVIVNVRGFSRNLRKEINKMSRYYFYDNGIRNALINNFNSLSMRNDVGMLWENYLVMERLKKQAYSGLLSNNYFWRTYDQKEVDWVEEREGRLFGYEFKWGEKKPRPPRDWLKTYSNASYEVIDKSNFLEFVL